MEQQDAGRDRVQRLRWMKEARFGLFVHWGLYSQIAGKWNGETFYGVGEWIKHQRKIPDAEDRTWILASDPARSALDGANDLVGAVVRITRSPQRGNYPAFAFERESLTVTQRSCVERSHRHR